MHDGGLVPDGDHLLLTVDLAFETPSGAANFAAGRAKNDPEGAGRAAHLSTHSSELVDAWLAVIRCNEGAFAASRLSEPGFGALC